MKVQFTLFASKMFFLAAILLGLHQVASAIAFDVLSARIIVIAILSLVASQWLVRVAKHMLASEILSELESMMEAAIKETEREDKE